MGLRYSVFRLYYEVSNKLGFWKRKFPTSFEKVEIITLNNWRSNAPIFFFNDVSSVNLPELPFEDQAQLKQLSDNILKGKFQFFSSISYDLGPDYNWVTNPDTGFIYDANLHFTQIKDLDPKAGDIKYVWEKSRFAWLHTLMRSDKHLGTNHGDFVISEILSWIAANPINRGPNWKCSQETSLRILNWTWALYFYKHHIALTETVWNTIQQSIYAQLHHVYQNIHFSRIAVRNNHAITETMMLYLSGLLFPWFPESKKWLANGKQWLEQEIEYQLYADGTFLQFSMNYHRVAIQLLTWTIGLSKLHNINLAPVVNERASQSLKFLYACMDTQTGFLPNYGNNDGAIFFPLNSKAYRNYKPQLAALAQMLGHKQAEAFEDAAWFNVQENGSLPELSIIDGAYNFPIGGFYLLREGNTLTFIRCGKHKDRPAQSDNLHLDIWVNGENLLVDAGSYKYNTTPEELNSFFGDLGHNVFGVKGFNQMLKGGRFIWYYWSQAKEAEWIKNPQGWEFNGAISAYQYLSKDCIVKRSVFKPSGRLEWHIDDEIIGIENQEFVQNWLVNNHSSFKVMVSNEQSSPISETAYVSNLYGTKTAVDRIYFENTHGKTSSIIKIEKGLG